MQKNLLLDPPQRPLASPGELRLVPQRQATKVLKNTSPSQLFIDHVIPDELRLVLQQQANRTLIDQEARQFQCMDLGLMEYTAIKALRGIHVKRKRWKVQLLENPEPLGAIR
jgi:hypothetical protein